MNHITHTEPTVSSAGERRHTAYTPPGGRPRRAPRRDRRHVSRSAGHRDTPDTRDTLSHGQSTATQDSHSGRSFAERSQRSLTVTQELRCRTTLVESGSGTPVRAGRPTVRRTRRGRAPLCALLPRRRAPKAYTCCGVTLRSQTRQRERDTTRTISLFSTW